MRAQIVKTCTVVCSPGSVVEITQDQFLALGDSAVEMDTEKRTQGEKKTGKSYSGRG